MNLEGACGNVACKLNENFSRYGLLTFRSCLDPTMVECQCRGSERSCWHVSWSVCSFFDCINLWIDGRLLVRDQPLRSIQIFLRLMSARLLFITIINRTAIRMHSDLLGSVLGWVSLSDVLVPFSPNHAHQLDVQRAPFHVLHSTDLGSLVNRYVRIWWRTYLFNWVITVSQLTRWQI